MLASICKEFVNSSISVYWFWLWIAGIFYQKCMHRRRGQPLTFHCNKLVGFYCGIVPLLNPQNRLWFVVMVINILKTELKSFVLQSGHFRHGLWCFDSILLVFFRRSGGLSKFTQNLQAWYMRNEGVFIYLGHKIFFSDIVFCTFSKIISTM